jgi:glycosyltransferase involved in cell wall biosynthesis
MEAPRVLRVITDLRTGAPAREAVFLTEELRERGFDTRLVWGCAPPGAGSQDPRAGVPNTYVPWLSSGVHLGEDARATAAIRGIARRWHPDVVHTHLAKAGMLGRAAGLRAHVPVLVHTFRGDDAHGRATAGRVERALAARTDALIAPTAAVRDRLRSMGIGNDRTWRIIPVGVALEPFLREGIGRDAARRRLGLPAEGSVVLNLGSLDDRGSFLRAARVIVASRPDTTFVVLRDGPVSEDAMLDATSVLAERVRFVERTDDLPVLFAASDIALLTSCGEDAPSVLIEAVAAMTPVVAADAGGVPEVVIGGLGGDLVAPGDHRALAAAVGSLLDDPARAASYAAAGRAHVRARFSGDRLAADLADLYAELLGRRSMVTARPGTLTSARGT